MATEPDTVETPVEPTAPAPEPATPAPDPTPQPRVVVDPRDGSRLQVTEDEYKSLADMGFAKLRGADDPKPEPEPEPEPVFQPVETNDDDDDPRFQTLSQQVAEAHKVISELQESHKTEKEEREKAKKEAEDRAYLERLARENNVDLNNDKQRGMIEDMAMREWRTALEQRKPVTYESIYKESAEFVMSMSRSGKRDWVENKMQTRETAAEGPGGSAAMAPEPPKLPESKEEQRKLAAEFDNGAITARAHERFNRLMNRS